MEAGGVALPAVTSALEQSYEIPGDRYLVEQPEIIAATLYTQYCSEQQSKLLGKYGRMWKTYFKSQHPILYDQLLVQKKL